MAIDLKLQELFRRQEKSERRMDVLEEEHGTILEKVQEIREHMVNVEGNISSYNSRFQQFHEVDLPRLERSIEEHQAEMKTLYMTLMEERVNAADERGKDRVALAELKTENRNLKEEVRDQKVSLRKVAGVSVGSSGVIVGLLEIIKGLLE